MYFYPFEFTTPHITYALLGAFIVLFGMFSLFLRERLYIGEAIWAFIFGVIIGPYGANIFNPRAWGDPEEHVDIIIIEFTRVVLAIGVFTIGVELPKAYVAKHWKSLFFLLVPGPIWGWFVCAGFIYALIPGLNFLASLAISACLTPTDPILASAVIGGKWADKHVPGHIRHLLAAESGCNDGVAFLFLFFALYLMTELPSVGVLWLYQIIVGIILGSFLGVSFRHLMKFCQRHDFIDRQSSVAQYLSLAILTIGLSTLLGTNDLLAAFACGTSFAWDGFFNKQTEDSVFSSVIDTLFNVAAFIFVGAWMPLGSFHLNIENGIGMGAVHVWRLVVLAVLVLLFRRLPIMMGMYRRMPDVRTWREAVFTGHFGPMGIGAIFISTFASKFLDDYISNHPSTTGQEHQLEMVRDMIQPIIAFIVLCSITIHGLSITFFSLGMRVHSVSRTWSRRDTTGSGRTGAPDWTNQARLVTRAEDIVINRDLERGDVERAGGVPLERTMTMVSMRKLNADEQKEEDDLKSHAITQEPYLQVDPAPPTAATTPNQQNLPPDGEHYETSQPDRHTSTTSWTGQKLHELQRGAEEIGHSMRDGALRSFVLGKTSGGASDGDKEMAMETRPTTADTLVADEEPCVSYVHHSEEVSAQAPISGAEAGIGADTGDQTAAVPTTRNPPGPARRDRKNRRRSSSLTRLTSRDGRNQQETSLDNTIVNLNLDSHYPDNDYNDYAANKNGDNEIIEVPRGREGRLEGNELVPVFRRTMSNPKLGMGRSSGGLYSTPPGSSSILAPIFSYPTVPLPYSPHSPSTAIHSRPRTAPTSPTTWTTSSSPLPIPSRPGTGDSTGSVRHHRLDSIRVNGRRTRESSPSRSVRFVDGESGSSANGNGTGARKVLVVEIPPPLPHIPSRSSSFYKERDTIGRTLVDSPVEGNDLV